MVQILSKLHVVDVLNDCADHTTGLPSLDLISHSASNASPRALPKAKASGTGTAFPICRTCYRSRQHKVRFNHETPKLTHVVNHTLGLAIH